VVVVRITIMLIQALLPQQQIINQLEMVEVVVVVITKGQLLV
tara:strand:- start:304 stop:429 length:126 start_codon:yes stop_codon:yes gene_type:complete